MKQSILLLLALLFAAQIFAQITVERADYTLSTDVATTVNGWEMDNNGVGLPQEGADVTWDYSGQALTAPDAYTKNPVSEPLFPSANLVEYTSGLALGLVPQDVNFYEELADDGFKVLGRITSPETLPSQPLTGGPNDTISFLGTMSLYDEPIYYVKFPLNYQDSWATEINIGGDYLMTVEGFGLDHVPASSNYNYVETNTVAGHGTLILPHPDGNGTVSLEALLLKSTTVRTDSFFLAGQPAPQLMLDVLGVAQGQIDSYSSYAFYAKGLNRSALRMEAKNGQVTGISMADDIKNIVSSTKLVAENLIDTKVFPNPTSGNFQINFEKPDAQTWTLEVFNSVGQKIKNQALESPAGNLFIEVNLGKNAQAGVHYFILRNSENMLTANGKILVK